MILIKLQMNGEKDSKIKKLIYYHKRVIENHQKELLKLLLNEKENL